MYIPNKIIFLNLSGLFFHLPLVHYGSGSPINDCRLLYYAIAYYVMILSNELKKK